MTIFCESGLSTFGQGDAGLERSCPQGYPIMASFVAKFPRFPPDVRGITGPVGSRLYAHLAYQHNGDSNSTNTSL